jgi:hypothetical protein
MTGELGRKALDAQAKVRAWSCMRLRFIPVDLSCPSRVFLWVPPLSSLSEINTLR